MLREGLDTLIGLERPGVRSRTLTHLSFEQEALAIIDRPGSRGGHFLRIFRMM